MVWNGARKWIRTTDLLITNQTMDRISSTFFRLSPKKAPYGAPLDRKSYQIRSWLLIPPAQIRFVSNSVLQRADSGCVNHRLGTDYGSGGQWIVPLKSRIDL